MSNLSATATALITGASSGVGGVYAERLAALGHDLLLVARNRQRLKALAADLMTKYGINMQVLSADPGEPTDLAQVEQRLRSDEAIGVLVNNAGIALHGTLTEVAPAQVESLVALNIISVTRLAAAAAAQFSGTGRGTIINIASVVALTPEMFNAVYSASKAYVLSLSQTLHG